MPLICSGVFANAAGLHNPQFASGIRLRKRADQGLHQHIQACGAENRWRAQNHNPLEGRRRKSDRVCEIQIESDQASPFDRTGIDERPVGRGLHELLNDRGDIVTGFAQTAKPSFT
jgi:hypothetical protein